MDSARLFSLREANALVGLLQETFTRARGLRDKLSALQEGLAREGRPLESPDVRVEEDAPSPVRGLQEEAVAVLDALRELLRELTELGVEVKAADGLVDFRSKLRGRVVYLCWKFGEERITHFHELDAGFAGRQPLPQDAEFVGDLLH